MLLDENDSHALQGSKPKSQNGKQNFWCQNIYFVFFEIS